ncbi:type II toxin-antitoxin system death-on-curing family toxin [Hazenella sp. IB182353]|uniref:type II toxin-antitoxin system death-on-curing family toxin n=1 Tax=Polycladospora coralii TaxID=2771432 RepID=UPI0017465CD7|nr:type II toxin-antitoxin system death-on-curing family toxin [Polycladospora coralii]MBS7529363.1 type II toxin-antitoxin system death-on-curing family toxin [Polycladospora coralii]
MGRDIRYLTVSEIVEIHMMIMRDYGEGEQAGVMFPDRLESASERPKAVFFEKELYPTIWDKAACLLQSIIQEHIFHNGNKRTGLACMEIFLMLNGYQFRMRNGDTEEFIVNIAMSSEYKGKEGVSNMSQVIQSFTIPISLNR